MRKTFVLASGFGTALTIAGSALVEPRSAVWLLGAAGVFFGLSTPTMFAMTGTLAGPRAAGRWSGAQNVAGQLAGILAPVVTGLIVDRTGRFSWAFAVSAAASLLATVAMGTRHQAGGNGAVAGGAGEGCLQRGLETRTHACIL